MPTQKQIVEALLFASDSPVGLSTLVEVLEGPDGEHQVDHQMHHVARREVLAGILVQRLVELPEQLLEDRPHGGVVDLLRVQVHVPEALEHLEEKSGFVELADGVVEIELLQHLAHVGAEAGDVVAQVSGEVRRIGQ